MLLWKMLDLISGEINTGNKEKWKSGAIVTLYNSSLYFQNGDKSRVPSILFDKRTTKISSLT